MKKITTLFLALAMVFSLCACGNSEGAETTGAAPEGLQVGYAKINITPDYVVGLGGYSDSESRASTGFVDYIYTTCIAVTSGEDTILMYTVDNCSTSLSVKKLMRQQASMATGIPEEKIFIGATHGHNCPSLGGYDNAERYQTDFYAAAVKAAQEALEDRAPAQLLRAKAIHEQMNSVRHYTLADGTFTDSNGASRAGVDNLVGHPMESDRQMVMLKFDREGDSKDILLVNWQAHPDSASEIGYNLISPSWIGPMRNKLEKDTGMHVAYFTGASGNQTKESKIPSENRGNYTYAEYGEELANCAFSMLESLEPVEGIAIKTTRTTMDVDVDHSWDHLLKEANEVYDLWKSAGKSAGDALAQTYNMSSSYHARAIRSRAAMGKTITMELSAFSIGGVGFTTGTYEMFSTNAMFVKDNSPFETTFVITGCSSYVPSDIAYTYRGYEADTGLYARGVGEQLADQYVKMLGEVK